MEASTKDLIARKRQMSTIIYFVLDVSNCLSSVRSSNTPLKLKISENLVHYPTSQRTSL